jgi:hypothetical protein
VSKRPDVPNTTPPDPDRIWLEPRSTSGIHDERTWCQHDVWTGEPDYAGRAPTEYVRADIARAEIDRLRAHLRVIAGEEQCADNLLGNADIARIALHGR